MVKDLAIEIGLATEADLDSILDLQTANQLRNGGLLTANLPRAKIAEIMNGMPLVVARRNSDLVGFLMSATREMYTDVPVIQAMLETYPGSSSAYVYGPICVGEQARGQGLAQAMFAALTDQLTGREGILFIRRDNIVSIRAHSKMGVRLVGDFIFNGLEHAVFAYVG